MPGVTSSNEGISLGVVGHRLDKLNDHDLLELRRPVQLVLDRLELLSVGSYPPVVVTSLAEGADRLVASEALLRGLSITVVLPFGKDVFKDDCSSDASRQEFEALLAQATHVIEPVDGAISGDSGYYWASMHIVGSSDVLIAVWDGEPGRGPGGTAGAIDEALIAEIPVVWVLSHSPYSIDIVEPPVGRSPGALHQVLASLSMPESLAD